MAKADRSKALDGKVDKIIGKIKENINAVQDLKNNGIPSGSSMAFRVTSNLPDWSGDYNKIKGQLSPEQDARIKAEENKLNRLIDRWN